MISVFKWKPRGEIPLGRLKQQKWIDKVKKNLAEIGIQVKKYYHRIETGGSSQAGLCWGNGPQWPLKT